MRQTAPTEPEGEVKKNNKKTGKLATLAGRRAASDTGLQGSLAAEILWLYYCPTGRAGLVLG